MSALWDLLLPHGEFLPLDCPDGSYCAYNVTRVIDVMDEDDSELERFSDGGIMDIVRPAFYAERIASEVIFKLPQMRSTPIFVTDRFVERIEEHGLVGFDLKPVWSGPEGRQRTGTRSAFHLLTRARPDTT
jgi:hypothetical protein